MSEPRVPAETVRTARLDLLPLRVEHAEEMAVVLSDPALHTFIGGAPLSPADLRARYERLVAGSPDPAVSWCNWVLRLRAEARLVGTVQATISARHPLDDHGAEIAWTVGAPWQGRGFASEAAKGLVDWLGRRSVRTVVAHIHPAHADSAAVAAAAGLAPTDEEQDGETRWRLTSRP
ncbi:RimJ/RimL family protein N-acetyltransferase [Streptomyces sp. V4I8]|uniref:GNAT family N-acetyltransferase n=1 Tax=Streptomyces sp. V4I8 TaxID=3156469 RepID=UPI003510F78E